MDGRTLGGKTAMFLIIGLFMVVFLALFGTSYAVVGVTVASAAMIMLSKDLSVRPFSNLCSIMVFMVLMGVGAFLASLDPYLGLLVNFIVVFLVVFLSMQDLKSPMHFPMLLFYVTMVTTPITISEMPDRLLVLAVSAVFIVGLNVVMNRGSRSRTSHNGIAAMCEEIRRCSGAVLRGESPDHSEIDRLAADLNRNMYDRLKSHFFTTPNDRTVLDLAVSLADLGRVVCRGDWSEDSLRNLGSVLDAVVSHERGECGASDVRGAVESYLASNPGAAGGTDLILRDIHRELAYLESGGDDSTYGSERGRNIGTVVKALREEARRDSARFTFAVRMGLIFAMVAFAWEYWGWENAQVLLYTVIALIVPYVEDSWKMSVMRFSGTVLGVLVFAVAVIATGDNSIALTAVGVVAAYVYVLMDDGRYDRKMFLFTLLVMIVSSLTADTPESGMVTDRVMFTAAGIMVATIANRVVLPYRVRDENVELSVRSVRISLERIHNIRDALDGRKDPEEEAGLTVLSASISQKMMLNADRESDPLARKFLMRQDSLSIQCSSLYKAIPQLSEDGRRAVADVMSDDPDSDSSRGAVETDGLGQFDMECVRRAEAVMATYRKNRRMMMDMIVEGYLKDGPVASLRVRP